jgi:hypothetical protein
MAKRKLRFTPGTTSSSKRPALDPYPEMSGWDAYGLKTKASDALSGAQDFQRWGMVTTKRKVPTNAETLRRYGRSWSAATEAQRANRAADYYSGPGRYRRRRKRRRRGGRGMYHGNGMYHGRGGFWSDAVAKGGWLRKGGLDLVQTGLGNVPVFGGILSNAFGGIRKATGIGDYATASNVLVDGTSGSSAFEAPSFVEISDTGAIIISHREYVGNIYGPSAGVDFETQEFMINPGIEETFPWLSQIAANYEEYEMVQLIFSYKSTVSNFQTQTGVTGTVLSATQYDTLQPSFEDKKRVMETHGATSCKATQNLVAGVECDPTKLSGTPNKYVRSQGLPDNRDPKEYDHGRFVIALTDFPDILHDQAIGELWVSYTVKLQRPRVFTGRGNSISTDHHYLTLPSANTGVLPTQGPTPLPFKCTLSYDGESHLTSSVTAFNLEGTSQLWDNDATINLMKNSQNSLNCKIEEGENVAVLVNTLGDGQRIHCVPFGGSQSSSSKEIGSVFSQCGKWQALLPTSSGALIPIQPRQGALEPRHIPVKITFPARYSGTVKVRYECEFQSQATPVDDPMQFAQAVAYGNVEGVYDMLSSSRQAENNAGGVDVPDMAANSCVAVIAGGVSNCAGLTSNAAGAIVRLAECMSKVFIECHVEVKPATDGRDNVLELRGLFLGNCGGGVWNGSSKVPINHAQDAPVHVSLSITEYNSTLVDQRDIPTIVNVQTEQRLVQDRAYLDTFEP